MTSEVFNTDCLEYMRTLPDKAFQLTIADPPYGDANSDVGGGKRFGERFDRYKQSEPCGGGADLKGTTVSRTGGTWAAKYGKKSSAGTKHPSRYSLMNSYVFQRQLLYGAEIISAYRLQGVSLCGRKRTYPKTLRWLCVNTHGLR